MTRLAIGLSINFFAQRTSRYESRRGSRTAWLKMPQPMRNRICLILHARSPDSRSNSRAVGRIITVLVGLYASRESRYWRHYTFM